MHNNFKYIICDSNKAPIHGFDVVYTLSEVRDKDNVAVAIEEPYVVVDIDTEDEFQIVYKIIQDLKIKTRILKTARGGHFWFKSEEPMTNIVHKNTPLTIKIDIKSWGKRTMEVVKRDGVWREWLQFDDVVDPLPFFLKPINTEKSLLHMENGEGRNNGLFTFILPLMNSGFKKEEIRNIFYLINNYIFSEPLKTSEIDAMIDTNKIFESPSLMFYRGATFLHNEFADYMISQYNMKCYCGEVYYYNGSYYVKNREQINAMMVKALPIIKKQNRTEVYETIKYKLLTNPVEVNKKYINLKNGLYCLSTGLLMPHTPAIFTVNQLNCEYKPNCVCDIVDKTLDNVCCHNNNIKKLLIQMMGYILLPDCRLQKSFILLGDGSNGKSLVLDMIRCFIGENNCSSLALEDLSERFRTAELVGAMANIGDDSGQSLLENTAIFKKLVTGDSIVVERKHETPFKYSNTAKMLFALNNLPPTTDKSDGFFRRCIIIPFNARFSPSDKDYDMNLIDKVTTPEARNYLLKLAIEGLQEILSNKQFSESEETMSVKARYEMSNNNVLMWLECVDTSYNSLTEAYAGYVSFCTKNGYKPCNIIKFQGETGRYKKDLIK